MNPLAYKLDAALDVLDCKIVPRDGEDDQTDVETINCVVAHMEHTLDEHIRDAMLDYLLAMPDDWNPNNPPVVVTAWDERPYMPSACDMCEDEPPEITIHYMSHSGDPGWYVVQDDFGSFIRRLCAKGGLTDAGDGRGNPRR